MEFVNLTPHPIITLVNVVENPPQPIDLDSGDSYIFVLPSTQVETVMVIPPSGKVARIEEHPLGEFIYSMGGGDLNVTITQVSYSKVVDLPAPSPNKFYIVSLIVAWAHPLRQDLVFPYPLVRDESGRVIGCSGFGRVG